MNVPAISKMQLPAHLAHLTQNAQLMTQLTTMNTAASAGISAGGWPRISLKQAKFRLQSPSQDEIIVPQLHLDVIIIDANPNGVSKVFYEKQWDPNGEGEAPDCYSDNGIGPSSKAAKPQCGTCAACPQNVWGSKISQGSGKQIKACTDTKKIAVFIADNVDGPVFELRVPADSLSNLGQYVKSLDKHGIPVCMIVTRLTFDPAVSHPKLVFTPAIQADGQLPYINQDQAAAVMEVLGTEEVDQCTGKNDKPIAANAAISSGNVQAAVAAQNTAAALAQMYPVPAMPPQNIAPPSPSIAQQLPPVSMPPQNIAPPVSATLQVGAIASGTTDSIPPKRIRGKKLNPVPMTAEAAATPLPPILAQMPPPIPTAAAVAAPITAPVTSAALDDLIAQALQA